MKNILLLDNYYSLDDLKAQIDALVDYNNGEKTTKKPLPSKNVCLNFAQLYVHVL